jgi:signal transduction histidine kinase
LKNSADRASARHYLRSSSFKMALFFTLMLGLTAGVLGYFSYYFNRSHYIGSADAIIDTDLSYLDTADRSGGLLKAVTVASGHPGRAFLLTDASYHKLAGNLGAMPQHAQVLTEGTILFDHEDRSYAAKIRLFPDGRALLAGTDITDAVISYRVMQWLSFLSIALTTVVVVASFAISTFVVSRTNRIAATAKLIMDTGDLSKRIEIDARWDDLSNMAYVLNAFLDRVEQLLQGIRRVSDNVAHDLRTPLTRLLNNLEALRVEQSVAADDYALQRCDAMIGETARLLDTFNALLRITNIETVRQRQNFASLDLRQIVLDVIELYEPLAEEKGIAFDSTLDNVSCTGDRDLLFQAIANLVDNAVKFTSYGRVQIKLLGDDHPRLTIIDSGPGVAEDEREKVFDRFYRADASRSTEGNGLGLSLVAAVIALHGGSITLGDAAPGLIVTIVLGTCPHLIKNL